MVNYIRTYTGKKFDFLNMDPKDVNIIDIAHALSNFCRFVGHTPYHYSVAQHSVYVSRLCPDKYKLEGLMHDASEAYLGDIASPLKQHLKDYKGFEKDVDGLIREKYNLPMKESVIVKEKDQAVLQEELCQIMRERDVCPGKIIIEPWSAQLAEKIFLREFHKLAAPEGTGVTPYAV